MNKVGDLERHAAPGSRLRQWWARRPLRARITLVIGLVSLIVLLALSRLGVVFLYGAVLDGSERWLDANGLAEDGPLPSPDRSLAHRFSR